MPEKNVQVTLTQPFGAGPLLLRYGTEDAIPRGQQSRDALQEDGPVAIQDVRYYNAGSAYIPGAPITYGPMDARDPDNNACIMPVSVAKHFFGDWDLKPGKESWNPRLTFGAEKNRVALVWGGYTMKTSAQLKSEHIERDTTKLGPPNVPHVIVQYVDARGRLQPGLHHDPWAHFGWDQDAYASVPQIHPSGIDITALSASIREQVIAEMQKADHGKRQTKA